MLILGSTGLNWFGTTLPSVSMTGYPINELYTSALSALPRRPTEGVLEVEVPTSVDNGVPSCLPLNSESVSRRLPNDLLDDIFFVSMTQVGGLQMQRGHRKALLYLARTP